MAVSSLEDQRHLRRPKIPQLRAQCDIRVVADLLRLFLKVEPAVVHARHRGKARRPAIRQVHFAVRDEIVSVARVLRRIDLREVRLREVRHIQAGRGLEPRRETVQITDREAAVVFGFAARPVPVVVGVKIEVQSEHADVRRRLRLEAHRLARDRADPARRLWHAGDDDVAKLRRLSRHDHPPELLRLRRRTDHAEPLRSAIAHRDQDHLRLRARRDLFANDDVRRALGVRRRLEKIVVKTDRRRQPRLKFRPREPSFPRHENLRRFAVARGNRECRRPGLQRLGRARDFRPGRLSGFRRRACPDAGAKTGRRAARAGHCGKRRGAVPRRKPWRAACGRARRRAATAAGRTSRRSSRALLRPRIRKRPRGDREPDERERAAP